jgi:transglutaminase-like putative cysteine protease
MVAGPVVAAFDSAPAFREFHAGDPTGLAFVQTWIQRMQDSSAFADNAFVLFVIVWLMWITGAWLAWCVLRWHQPLIGLIPGAAAFATNVLNWPQNQNGFTLGFLVLTFALLLWTNYTGSVAKATRARVKLTGDARWDFWESGLVATAVLIVLGIMLPPLSTVDRTATTASSLFSTWAQLQQQLNHPSDSSLTGAGSGSGTTGFTTEVKLAGQVKKSSAVVFTYTVAGTYIGPKYFRGVSITDPVNGEWKYDPNAIDFKQQIPRLSAPQYAESYQNETFATFTVNMNAPPPGNVDVLFYPGQMVKADRDTIATEILTDGVPSLEQPLYTLDRLSSRTPPSSKGGYNITSEYPNAFESDLRQGGTPYLSWLAPYMSLPPNGYRSPEVLAMEKDLALRITAGKTNVYDIATAIQDYFRGGTFKYTLTPGNPPAGVDYMDYFLNTSHAGYCEYFAIAMGDMLRLLGIPTRLVNGFGPGTYHAEQNRYVVTAADAHTWVEVYFPNYGWIPFEPTPDQNYSPITRGHTDQTNLCVNDTLCAGTTTGSTGSSNPGRGNPEGGRPGGNQAGASNAGNATGPLKFLAPDAGTVTKILAVLLAVMLLLAALVSRYLRPRTVMGVWQRTLVLARLAGAAVLPGETPFELGRRLARVFPEVETPAVALAGGFAVAAYAPPDAAQESRASVMEAWAQLRPLMLRRVARRLRPARS